MGKEYEGKFLDIDVDLTREKLKKIGATQVHENIRYTRSVFSLCSEQKGYVRVRSEGDKVTMTSKIYIDPRFPEEYEIDIKDDFETGFNFLKSLGMTQKAFQETFQETFREKWKHPDVHEIVFDTVPGLPTYMEVDCNSEDDLNKMIDVLELDKSKMRFGAFDKTYNEYYGIDTTVINDHTPSLTFKNIVNEINPAKNHKLLEEISQKHLNMFSSQLQSRTKSKRKNAKKNSKKKHSSKKKYSSKKKSKNSKANKN